MTVTYADAWARRGAVQSAEPSQRPVKVTTPCEHCGKPYKSVGALKAHIATHHIIRYHDLKRALKPA